MRLYELSFHEIEEFFYRLAEVRDVLKGDGYLSFLPELRTDLSPIQGTLM
jgi:pyridoxal phosphate synthase yaaD subunit